jgi:hypothetical protein
VIIDIICSRRPAVWPLLAFCFASAVFADSRDPVVLKSQVVSLDVPAIERDANAGTPFALTFGGTRLNVALSPAPLWPKEGLQVLEIGKDGQVKERIVQGNITYAGDVIGEDPAVSEARFTIAHGVLEGYVLSSTGWWFIEPLSQSDPKAGPGDYLVYASRDLDVAVDYGDDEVKANGALDEVSQDPNDPRIRVAMVADLLYVSLSGQPFGWIERQAGLLNKVNGIYRDQVHREFRMPVVVADFGGTSLTSTDPGTLLIQLETVVRHVLQIPGLTADIAHLTTAKNLDGDIGGISETRGHIGLSQQVLVTASAGSARTQSFLNTLRAAHEIGHNFDGRHEFADEWCVTHFVICLDHERTIMWPSVYPDTNARFSDGTRNPLHNNRQRIDAEMTRRHFPAMP